MRQVSLISDNKEGLGDAPADQSSQETFKPSYLLIRNSDLGDSYTQMFIVTSRSF
jgi:hypothetical protein